MFECDVEYMFDLPARWAAVCSEVTKNFSALLAKYDWGIINLTLYVMSQFQCGDQINY